MTNNYNKIASIYDVLSRLVYKKSIINAQKFLLKQIQDDSTILIVGGGTGWILEEIATRHQNIKILYVEKSDRMIVLSKKRNYKSSTVEFINTAIEDFSTDIQYDIIFTAFFFDNFKSNKIELIFSKLSNNLKQNGLWLYADFVNHPTTLWQKFLLKTMYLFFKLTCNIETQQLTDMSGYFTSNYIKVNETLFYKNFIQSKVYKKV